MKYQMKSMKERTLLFVARLSGENYFKWVTTDGYKKRWSSENVIEKKVSWFRERKTRQLMYIGKICVRDLESQVVGYDLGMHLR